MAAAIANRRISFKTAGKSITVVDKKTIVFDNSVHEIKEIHVDEGDMNELKKLTKNLLTDKMKDTSFLKEIRGSSEYVDGLIAKQQIKAKELQKEITAEEINKTILKYAKRGGSVGHQMRILNKLLSLKWAPAKSREKKLIQPRKKKHIQSYEEELTFKDRYVSNPVTFMLMLDLLTEKNRQFDAFHIFKMFVENAYKSPAVWNIVCLSREKLIKHLDTFEGEKYSALDGAVLYLRQHIKQMKLPK